ncbi:hypothetical protein Tco_0083928 [Tanacetum coccineum]
MAFPLKPISLLLCLLLLVLQLSDGFKGAEETISCVTSLKDINSRKRNELGGKCSQSFCPWTPADSIIPCIIHDFNSWVPIRSNGIGVRNLLCFNGERLDAILSEKMKGVFFLRDGSAVEDFGKVFDKSSIDSSMARKTLYSLKVVDEEA